jgi:hypothetical protein
MKKKFVKNVIPRLIVVIGNTQVIHSDEIEPIRVLCGEKI